MVSTCHRAGMVGETYKMCKKSTKPSATIDYNRNKEGMHLIDECLPYPVFYYKTLKLQ